MGATQAGRLTAGAVVPASHPAIRWAESGLMDLCGERDRPGLMCPVPIASCADAALAALASLAPCGAFDGIGGAELLAERAAITGSTRAGAVSPGGSCHLLETADGWIALNLARDDDWALLPAWLEAAPVSDWELVASAVREKSAEEIVARGREIGLAVCRADVGPAARAGEEFHPPLGGRVRVGGTSRCSPLVLDLSSLWAGPLCGRLLRIAGARVIKVESAQRPDGARRGPAQFFDRMNAGKEFITLDFGSSQGRQRLRDLVAQADIVIEASRPRALRQLGLVVEDIVAGNPALTWISITGYGRGEPHENWIAYGDDAAVAAGLSQVMYEATGRRVICGDAIGDPLAGLHAALAAWNGWLRGGGGLIPISMREVVAQCIAFDLPPTMDALRARQREWTEKVSS